MAKMTISNNGLQHLIGIEGGAKLTMYNDMGKSKGHCTIGVGHLVHKGICNGIIPSEKPFLKGITLAHAKKLLKTDLSFSENAISGSVTVSLTQNQYDALVSFVFNIGAPKFRSSTLLKLLNSKQYKKAANEFLKWDKMTIGGKLITVPGLLNRRIAEKHLFEKVSP